MPIDRRAVHALFVLFSLFCAPSVAAQDPMTLKALARIKKFEALEPGLKAGDVTTASRYINQIGWAAKRLNVVSNKNEATWQDAAKRYQALLNKIKAKAGASKPKPAGDGVDRAKLAALDRAIQGS